MSKPILCLDFDGVCHSYTSGWKGAEVIPDEPVNGLFEFLEQAKEVFDIQIFSSRSNQPGGVEAMQRWFGSHYAEYISRTKPELKQKVDKISYPEYLSFPTKKPVAFIGLDDRVITFDGHWPGVHDLLNFQPWYKAETPSPRGMDEKNFRGIS
jgi:hypothetical protein